MSGRLSQPRGVLFSDLDGTLLDARTYQISEAAARALSELDAARVYVIPVTSKTAAEVSSLRSLLPSFNGAIVEGGAVLMDRAGSLMPLRGIRRHQLQRVLTRLQQEAWKLVGFSQMTPQRLSLLAGLTLDQSERALQRQASEPFTLSSDQHDRQEQLCLRARQLGAHVERGGRFWHLLGVGVTKGVAAAALIAGDAQLERAHLVCGAVGDAWNDLSLLTACDVGYLLGRKVEAEAVPPTVTRLDSEGPQGFSVAARLFLQRCVQHGAPLS